MLYIVISLSTLYLNMRVDFHQGFTNNKAMSLPVYEHINLKSDSLEDLGKILIPEINLKHPIVINLLELDLDQQRETIGLIENFFVSNNISFRFPYPLYILSHHELSITNVSLVHSLSELPKFFSQRETKMNVKEAHLAGKNKLLQQEVINNDVLANSENLIKYSEAHRAIYETEQERIFYHSLLNNLIRGNKDG